MIGAYLFGWMVDKFIEQFGIARTEALLSFNNEPAPITLRVNTLKTTLEELIEWIEKETSEKNKYRNKSHLIETALELLREKKDPTRNKRRSQHARKKV